MRYERNKTQRLKSQIYGLKSLKGLFKKLVRES